ncbi:MAG TPA: M90 family metallopeptidase [Kofleriaceae bacterium]|jgi:hypothetical protein
MGWLTEHRRHHLLETPFPDEWRAILDKNVAAYRLLAPDQQQHLRDLTQVFVAEKHWEGGNDLAVTDEMRVTIGGTACLMILGRDHSLFSEIVSIVIYASAVVTRRAEGRAPFAFGPIADRLPILGQSMRGGAVILAWDDVLAGARDPHDGRNLVFHELAHKIDEIGGTVDGTPPLPDAAHRRAWGEALGTAFLAQIERAKRGEKSLLRDYATTNEAEYFAVVTEVFFEQPAKLREALPDVYAVLAEFYGVDFG